MAKFLRGFNRCANPTTSEMTPCSSNQTSEFGLSNRFAPVLQRTRGKSTQDLFPPGDRDLVETLSSDYLWEQVFVSHSAKQRDFVEQLYMVLTRANISCFFDRYSLAEREWFNPTHRFEAPKECEVAIVVLSNDYITSKLSMRQLCAFVEAEKSVNSKLKIYPLFYEMSPDEFSQIIDDIEKRGYRESWGNFFNFPEGPIVFNAWLGALKALGSFEEPLYVLNSSTVDHRHKFLCDVHCLLSPNVKGKERLCQEVENLFEEAPYYKNGVKVIGLYGIDGSGKTTLCKSLCGFYSKYFEGRVFHAEFHQEGLPVETLKGLLQILTHANEESMKLVGNYEQALSLLKQQMRSQRVFLCLDNIPDRLKCVKEAQAYLTADFGQGSLVVLTARSGETLERVIPVEENRSFVPVPNLTEGEAIDVLLNLTEVGAHDSTLKEEHIVVECADLCRFDRGMSCKQGSYHPLALTILGVYLCEEFSRNPSEWGPTPIFNEYGSRHNAQEIIFFVFEQTFDALHPRSLRLLLLLMFYVPNFDFVQSFHRSAFQWLADVFSHESNESVRDAIYGMKNMGLIEMCGRNSISFHDLLVAFGKSKLERLEKWWSLEGKDELPKATPSIVEVIKLKNYTSSHTFSLNQFSNVSVVHLESVRNLVTLDFGPMDAVRSITIVDCSALEEIRDLRCLSKLRFLKIEDCESLVRCPGITDLRELRYLKMQLSRHSTQHEYFGDSLELLRGGYRLEEVYLDGIDRVTFCPTAAVSIRAVSISNCNYFEGDFTNCLKLEWIKLWNCYTMSRKRSLRLIGGFSLIGCINVRSICLHNNYSIKEVVGLDGLIAMEELHLMKMNSVEELPSFRHLGNLRHLTLHNMAKLKTLPDVSNCHQLTTVDINVKIGRQRITLRDVLELKELSKRPMGWYAFVRTLHPNITFRYVI